MYLSEHEFLTLDPLCREEPHWSIRNVLLHTIDHPSRSVKTGTFAYNWHVTDLLSVFRCQGTDFGVQRPNCGKADHFGCCLAITQRKEFPFYVNFHESIIGDWCLSPDKDTLLVAVITSHPLGYFMGQYLPLRPEMQNCTSKFQEILKNIGIYAIDLTGRSGFRGKVARPLFCRSNLEVGLGYNVHPFGHYLTYAVSAARNCIMICGDRMLSVKMGQSATRFFWLKAINGCAEFAYMTGTDKIVFDMTVDSGYLASFSTSDRSCTSIFVAKFCPLIDAFTIEGVTRPWLQEGRMPLVKSSVRQQKQFVKVGNF
jgi:hypothetical protein